MLNLHITSTLSSALLILNHPIWLLTLLYLGCCEWVQALPLFRLRLMPLHTLNINKFWHWGSFLFSFHGMNFNPSFRGDFRNHSINIAQLFLNSDTDNSSELTLRESYHSHSGDFFFSKYCWFPFLVFFRSCRRIIFLLQFSLIDCYFSSTLFNPHGITALFHCFSLFIQTKLVDLWDRVKKVNARSDDNLFYDYWYFEKLYLPS